MNKDRLDVFSLLDCLTFMFFFFPKFHSKLLFILNNSTKCILVVQNDQFPCNVLH